MYDTLLVTSCCLCVCGLFVFLSLCSSALKHFTTGLQADPTYVRALMCKAEAHTELNQVHTPIHTVCNLSLSLPFPLSIYMYMYLSSTVCTCTLFLITCTTSLIYYFLSSFHFLLLSSSSSSSSFSSSFFSPQYRDAVSDWSKAIHIYPNNPSFHLRQVCS